MAAYVWAVSDDGDGYPAISVRAFGSFREALADLQEALGDAVRLTLVGGTEELIQWDGDQLSGTARIQQLAEEKL